MRSFCAVLNDGNRDTLGALGVYLGEEALPLRWREKLENRQYIEGLAHDLAERAARG